MPRISRFVLGRYWTTAADQDKQTFQKLFEDYVVRAYAARFSEYSGEEVKVLGARAESETVTLVTSQFLRPNGAPPAKIDWRVRKQDNDFKIVDIDVEGVSMAVTQREEFGSVIQRDGGTVAGLNKRCRSSSPAATPASPRRQAAGKAKVAPDAGRGARQRLVAGCGAAGRPRRRGGACRSAS